MNKISLQTILTVLPMLSAALYLLGATYHQGYLEEFGVGDSLFPLSVDKSLLMGFISLLAFGLVPMVYACFAIFTLVFIVVFAAIISSTNGAKRLQETLERKYRYILRKHRYIPKRIRSFLKKCYYNRKRLEPRAFKITTSDAVTVIVDKGANLYIYVSGIIILLLALFVLALVSLKSGREQARREIEAFKKNTGAQVFLYETAKLLPIRAKQIFCGTSHCAYWVGTGSIVVKHEDIYRVTAHASQKY